MLNKESPSGFSYYSEGKDGKIYWQAESSRRPIISPMENGWITRKERAERIAWAALTVAPLGFLTLLNRSPVKAAPFLSEPT